jgi:hypothetical protein
MKTYSTVQLAKHLGIGRDSLYRWMRAKKITPGRMVRVPLGGGVMFQSRQWTEKDAASIKKFMKENYRKGRGRKPKPKP